MYLFQVKNNVIEEGEIVPKVIEYQSRSEKWRKIKCNESGLKNISYLGYFENSYGEQSIFLWDHQAQNGVLFCGDAGWGTKYEFDATTEIVPFEKGGAPIVFSGLILNPAEVFWLRSCLFATRGA